MYVDSLYVMAYLHGMQTALRDMQPWRRAMVELGLTMRWVADRTGKSRDTVQAYAIGRRNPSPEWLAEVARLLAEYEKGEAA